MKTCFLCGRNGSDDPLDRHHIFNGSYRKKSEKYGLTVYLCHDRCHETGEYAAHNCMETWLYLKSEGQKKVMEEQGWTTEEFIKEFGKNYVAIYEDLIKENDNAESDYCNGKTGKGSGAADDAGGQAGGELYDRV